MFFKRQLPVYIMVTVGILTLLGHFIKGGAIEDFIQQDSLSWFNIIASFSILLGAFNLLKIHFQKFFKKQKDWQYSLIALIGFMAMIVGGFFFKGANYLKIEINEKNIKSFVSLDEKGTFTLNDSFIDNLDMYFQKNLISVCDNSKYSNSLSCYDNEGIWEAKAINPSEFDDMIYDYQNIIKDQSVSAELIWMIYDYLAAVLKNQKYKEIEASNISIYNLKNILDDDFLKGEENSLITNDCFVLIYKDKTPFFKRGGYCDIGPIEDLSATLKDFPDWRFFEKFKDNNSNNRIDIAEEYTDSNDNGKYDEGEFFIDQGNGVFDEGDSFRDCGVDFRGNYICGSSLWVYWLLPYGNGKWNGPEQFTDLGNDIWDKGEEYIDSNNNGMYDEGELFIDQGNGVWDKGEDFVDEDEDGVWYPGEAWRDKGDGIWNDSERVIFSPYHFFFKRHWKKIGFKEFFKDYYDEIEEKGIVISKEFNRKTFSYSKLNNQIEPLNNQISHFISVESVDWGEHVTESGTFFKWLFDSAYSPIDMTMFALLAFFVASASYRAFRIRNFEASLLLLAGVLVMLGAVPIGDLVSSWMLAYLFLFILFAFLAPLIKNKKILYLGLGVSSVILLITVLVFDISELTSKSIAAWIITYPTVAGKKAIMIGIALGIVATSLRIIFGRDKSFLGD